MAPGKNVNKMRCASTDECNGLEFVGAFLDYGDLDGHEGGVLVEKM